MNKEIKEKWVAALRSGEYKQGEGVLKQHAYIAKDDCEITKHCCLGVLCEMYAEKNKIEWVEELKGFSLLDEHELLPSQVSKWAGLEECVDPCIRTSDGNCTMLSILNDKGKSFEEIANIIEAQL